MDTVANEAFFSDICVERCGGICCDPWWGIISYAVRKDGGLSSLSDFRAEALKGIKARRDRIVETYITAEESPRRLFTAPELYNVHVTDLRLNGSSISMSLTLMFAFKCAFLGADRACSIHPLKTGREIRPPHCGYLGTPGAQKGEKGYCRIIHAAPSDMEVIARAVETEKETARAHISTGFNTPEEAADKVVEVLKDFCARNAPQLFPQHKEKSPGRNDPCWCGSNKKFKKCHG